MTSAEQGVPADATSAPDAGRSSQLNRLFVRGFAETFVLDVVSRGLSAVTLVVLIRGLGVSQYAFVTLLIIFAQFVASAASGGVRLRYLRREAERISREDGEAASFGAALINGTVLLVGVALVLAPIVLLFVDVPARGSAVGLILYSIGFGVGWSAIELSIAHYQARRRFRLAGWIGVLRAALVLVVAIVVVAGGYDGLPGLALWFVGVMGIGGLAVAGLVLRSHGDAPARPRTRLRLTLTHEERWLTLYFLAASGFAYVDVIVASIFLDAKGVATLGATLRYLAIALAAVPALGAILRVRVSQIDIVDSRTKQRTFVIGWLRATLVPSAIGLVAAILLVPYVIPLVDGGRYPGSIVALQIFLAYAVVAYVTEPAPNILMAQDRNGALAALFGLALLVNFVGDVLVAPSYGVTGIAVVSASAFVALRAGTLGWALRSARSAGAC